jgi:uncharacterized integral membrane protein
MILRLIILIFLIFIYHEIQEINLNLKTKTYRSYPSDYSIFDERQCDSVETLRSR